MRKFGFGVVLVLVSGLVIWPSVLSSGGQQLTAQQMEALAANASTPSDHAQLRQHYLEMAAIYAADADAHVMMAKAYRRRSAQPSRAKFEDAAVQMDRIATPLPRRASLPPITNASRRARRKAQ